MLNRAVLLVRYRQPFIDWVNAVDPEPTRQVRLEELQDDNTAYLVPLESREELEEWLELNWELVFENELSSWYTDESVWPQPRSLALLQSWCRLELHTVVIDTSDEPLAEEDLDELDHDDAK
jgi:hypothetical protein